MVSFLVAIMLASALTQGAGEILSLSRAIEMARVAHPDARAAAAAEDAARAREEAARAAWFPRVTMQERWQRGNEPVFAFGALLDQRRFADANFAIATLNRPRAINDYRAGITIRQPLFDPAATTVAMGMARAGSSLAAADRREVAGDVAVAVAESYGRVLSAESARRAAEGAIGAAVSDRDRAAARRDAGRATDADVLAIDVHVARLRARAIGLRSDAEIARATLNRLIGVASDAIWVLADPADAGTLVRPANSTFEEDALRNRADVAAARSRVAFAEAAARGARAARRPTVALEGGLAWNGGTWTDRAASWVVGVRADLSLSTGGAEAAMARAAASHTDQIRARQAGVESAARLEVRSALARLESARARRDVGAAAIAQARESERIIRDRYEAGLATTTDVLRAAEALLEAEAIATTGRIDVATATVALDRAVGRVGASGPEKENP